MIGGDVLQFRQLLDTSWRACAFPWEPWERMVRAVEQPNDKFLTPDETASILGCSVLTLQDWRCKRRFLPYTKIGGRVRYRREDVDLLLNGGPNDLLADELLEDLIKQATHQIFFAPSIEERRKALLLQRELIFARTPAQVRRMELERGLT